MTYLVTLSCGNGLDWLTVPCVCARKASVTCMAYSIQSASYVVCMYYIPLLNAQRLQLCKYWPDSPRLCPPLYMEQGVSIS